MRSPVLLDQMRLTCPSDVTVTSTADSGAGSLRKALGSVCAGGTIRFAPALAGQTITLTPARSRSARTSPSTARMRPA